MVLFQVNLSWALDYPSTLPPLPLRSWHLFCSRTIRARTTFARTTFIALAAQEAQVPPQGLEEVLVILPPHERSQWHPTVSGTRQSGAPSSPRTTNQVLFQGS